MEHMKCSRNFLKDSSTEIERLQKTQEKKGKCKLSKKVMAEGRKVKQMLSIRRNSEGDQDSKFVTMMMICYTEL
jgi:hypothetical protein